MSTKIEWSQETWNPITGCSPVSEGCENCYARRMADRLKGRYGYPKNDPFRPGTFHPGKIGINIFRPGKRVFVCSMGDFFHDAVTREMREEVYKVIENHPNINFIFLTKRPQNVMSYWIGDCDNVWLGVTAENQQRADERIPILLQIPAIVRFVSVEPMLGPIDLIKAGLRPIFKNPTGDPPMMELLPNIDWVICGGETGPGARPMHPDWVRSLRNQCQESGTPFFFKSWGEWITKNKSYPPNEETPIQWINIPFVKTYCWNEDYWAYQVGKKAAGRILDGRTWEEYPNAK